MHNNRSHPLLEQVPLTVSPFVYLPTATTLSYNYKTMPSTLPPSSLGISAASDNPSEQPKPKYVISGSGHAAHPEDIIASCRALQSHLSKMQEDADRELREFEERIKERELAEKRRVAPGWLDSEARILEPERSTPVQSQGLGKAPENPQIQEVRRPDPADDQGAALDRAFGGMELK
ncbi:Fc.00g048670.m01.CDS01 [Cosmosporella sp. VM-42]